MASATKYSGTAPETEDHLFYPPEARWREALSGSDFWKLLLDISKYRLVDIFGKDLERHGKTYAIEVGRGATSLGCLIPSKPPQVRVNSYDKVRMLLSDGSSTVDLPVNDLRLYGDDQQTPKEDAVDDVNDRMNKGIGLILSLGLTRTWQKPDDTTPRHWLQVNNLHLEDNPTWAVGQV